MELTKDFESLIHLIARAFGRAAGNEAPEVHADVVVEHAKAIAAEDVAKAGNADASKPADASSEKSSESPATTEQPAQ